MRTILFLFVLSFGLSASAETLYQVYLLNSQKRFETGEELNLVTRGSRQFAVGATRAGYGALLEYSSFDTESGGGYARIGRKHEEILMWLKKDLGGWTSFRWLAGLAAGAMREQVTTRIEDLQTTDVGHNEVLSGVSLGATYSLALGEGRAVKKALQVSLEGRIFFAQSFDPNPQPDVVLRSGFQF